MRHQAKLRSVHAQAWAEFVTAQRRRYILVAALAALLGAAATAGFPVKSQSTAPRGQRNLAAQVRLPAVSKSRPAVDSAKLPGVGISQGRFASASTRAPSPTSTPIGNPVAGQNVRVRCPLLDPISPGPVDLYPIVHSSDGKAAIGADSISAEVTEGGMLVFSASGSGKALLLVPSFDGSEVDWHTKGRSTTCQPVEAVPRAWLSGTIEPASSRLWVNLCGRWVKALADGSFHAEVSAGECSLLPVRCDGALPAIGSSLQVELAPRDETTVALTVPRSVIGGIGMTFALTDGTVVVTAVRPSGPAALVGVSPGWKVVAVDGQPPPYGISDLVRAITGPVGSTVQVTYDRGGNNTTVALERVMLPLEHDADPSLPPCW